VPIYEYRCRACGGAFERLVQGAVAVACPACQSADVARTLSLFGVKSGGSFLPAAGGGCGCGAGGCGCH
jgi:putative FmdB family regulatory protein